MTVSEYFPFWDKLSQEQQKLILKTAVLCSAKKGEVIHKGAEDCIGLILIISGVMRGYILSDEGREITLYKLYDRDICLFSASCIMNSLQVDIFVEVTQDSDFFKIPANIYKQITLESAAAANYTNELMASRFSEVVWLLDQVLYKKMDSRIAAYILEEAEVCGMNTIKTTHDSIARNLGTAREVVSRMLKYLSSEGAVSVSRGDIKIENKEKLTYIAKDSIK